MSIKSKSEITVSESVATWIDNTMDEFEEMRKDTERLWNVALPTLAENDQMAKGSAVVLEHLGLLDHARDISELNAQRSQRVRMALEDVSKQHK